MPNSAPAPTWLPEHIDAIAACPLFKGLSRGQIGAILPCLNARVRHFSRGEYIVRMGDKNPGILLIIRGEVNIFREDWWGNRHIITSESSGGTIAESFALTPGKSIGVSAAATKDTTILSLDSGKILANCPICPTPCPHHIMIMENLVTTVADRNFRLNRKLVYLAQRTTREKILAYLSDESTNQNSASITIPFNRQELADFLSVNRSAMSAELCKMRDEGILNFNRNHFTLLRNPME